MSAPIPDREAQRLKALENQRILDTFPEKAFDDLSPTGKVRASPFAFR
jgi:hypothetical protein